MSSVHYAFDVFISYAQSDVEFARDLAGWLRDCHLKVWLAEEQLVPGSRFRAGLQQGILESRDLVAVLSPAYSKRPWTQREVDLFDLHADLADRRVFGLQIGDVPCGPVDQVFLVSQRIRWREKSFDPEGMLLLHCGLRRKRPGSRSDWAEKGRSLFSEHRTTKPDQTILPPNLLILSFDEMSPWGPDSEKYVSLVDRCLNEPHPFWERSFHELQGFIGSGRKGSAEEMMVDLWAVGHAERAAVLYSGLNPKPSTQYGPWSFLDSGCEQPTRWILISRSFRNPQESEIWFSWAVSDGAWSYLPEMAMRAPGGVLREHFLWLAAKAIDLSISFKAAEADYDYGVMITPWNHFHLCWLALRLGDEVAAVAHAEALCRTALQGDVRAGRFLARICSWPVYQPVILNDQARRWIVRARESLGLLPLGELWRIRERLAEIWLYSYSPSSEPDSHSGSQHRDQATLDSALDPRR